MATFNGGNGNDQKLSGFDRLFGNGGHDELAQGESTTGLIDGGAGDDILYFTFGGSGTIRGGAGNDWIDGVNLVDKLFGDAGDDRIDAGVGNDVVQGGAGRDLLVGSVGNDRVFGGDGNDDFVDISFPYFWNASGSPNYTTAKAGLYGSDGDDYVDGGKGNDYLSGDAGKDTVRGGLGSDNVRGGVGADTFLYKGVGESKPGAANSDFLPEFKHNIDVIDLVAIDANTGVAGNQKFKFIGAAAFHDKAGELRAAGAIVSGDINGDGKSDFELRFHNNPHVDAGDFLL